MKVVNVEYLYHEGNNYYKKTPGGINIPGGSNEIHLCRFVMGWNQSSINLCVPRTMNEHRRPFVNLCIDILPHYL